MLAGRHGYTDILDVPILRLLRGQTFEPKVVNAMVIALEETLSELKLTNRHDPIIERVAKIIVECAERGIRDPAEMQGLRAARSPESGPVDRESGTYKIVFEVT